MCSHGFLEIVPWICVVRFWILSQRYNRKEQPKKNHLQKINRPRSSGIISFLVQPLAFQCIHIHGSASQFTGKLCFFVINVFHVTPMYLLLYQNTLRSATFVLMVEQALEYVPKDELYYLNISVWCEHKSVILCYSIAMSPYARCLYGHFRVNGKSKVRALCR